VVIGSQSASGLKPTAHTTELAEKLAWADPWILSRPITVCDKSVFVLQCVKKLGVLLIISFGGAPTSRGFSLVVLFFADSLITMRIRPFNNTLVNYIHISCECVVFLIPLAGLANEMLPDLMWLKRGLGEITLGLFWCLVPLTLIFAAVEAIAAKSLSSKLAAFWQRLLHEEGKERAKGGKERATANGKKAGRRRLGKSKLRRTQSITWIRGAVSCAEGATGHHRQRVLKQLLSLVARLPRRYRMPIHSLHSLPPGNTAHIRVTPRVPVALKYPPALL